MHPRVSVSQLCSQKWSLDQDLAFYAAENITSAGFYMAKLGGDLEGGIRKIRAAGLRVSSVPMKPAPLLDGDTGSVLDKLRPVIDTAAALNGPCYFTSGRPPSALSTDEAYDALVPRLAPAVAYARSRAVRLCIEHNNAATRENGFIHSLADAVDLAKDTGVDICVELQNCWIERNLPRLFKQNVDRFAVVQVSDYRIGETTRFNRRVPGDGDIPLERLFGMLLEAGYTGLFELETLGTGIEEEGYPDTIRRGVAWVSEVLERLGA